MKQFKKNSKTGFAYLKVYSNNPPDDEVKTLRMVVESKPKTKNTIVKSQKKGTCL